MSKVVKLEDLNEGEFVQGTDGPVEVTKVHEKHLPDTMFKLEFDTGETIEASGNHLWYIETTIDRSLHRSRIKKFRKLFTTLPGLAEEELLELAGYSTHAEIALSDVLDLLEVTTDEERLNSIVRVAESLGHVAEEFTYLQDAVTKERVLDKTLRLYDARLFSQQLLALYSRKLEKKWPVIVGRVVTTEQLVFVTSQADIPEIRNLG